MAKKAMSFKVVNTVAAVLTFCFLFTATDAAAIDLTSSEKAKLVAGSTIRKQLPKSGKDGFYGGTGMVVINAPVEVVWKSLMDWRMYPKVFPKTLNVEKIAKKGNNTLVKMTMGHKLIRLEYHLNIRANKEKYTIAFDLVKNRPHDIESTKGYWKLFPQKDGRTLAVYVVAAKVPMGIINLLPKSQADEIAHYLVGAPHSLVKWLHGRGAHLYRTNLAKK